jgi:hypothetical protein
MHVDRGGDACHFAFVLAVERITLHARFAGDRAGLIDGECAQFADCFEMGATLMSTPRRAIAVIPERRDRGGNHQRARRR